MSPNHDPFEDDLRALERRELPAAWREEILHAAAAGSAPASQPAVSVAKPPRQLVPRWLVAGWGMAWAAALVLHLATPATPSAQERGAPPVSHAPDAALLPWEERLAAIEDLLAAN